MRNRPLLVANNDFRAVLRALSVGLLRNARNDGIIYDVLRPRECQAVAVVAWDDVPRPDEQRLSCRGEAAEMGRLAVRAECSGFWLRREGAKSLDVGPLAGPQEDTLTAKRERQTASAKRCRVYSQGFRP
jgi:hypothetical protein